MGQQTTPELVVGSDFAGYRIEEVAARGGMGVVYRATQLRLTRMVALKLVTPALARERLFPRAVQARMDDRRFDRSPEVIPVYEAGEEDGVLFIAMRWVEGTNLRDTIDRGPLEPARAAHLVSQVASALDAAHERDLIHRDVKPANILDHRPGPRLPDGLRPHEARQLDQRPHEDGSVDGHGRLHGAGADRRACP